MPALSLDPITCSPSNALQTNAAYATAAECEKKFAKALRFSDGTGEIRFQIERKPWHDVSLTLPLQKSAAVGITLQIFHVREQEPKLAATIERAATTTAPEVLCVDLTSYTREDIVLELVISMRFPVGAPVLVPLAADTGEPTLAIDAHILSPGTLRIAGFMLLCIAAPAMMIDWLSAELPQSIKISHTYGLLAGPLAVIATLLGIRLAPRRLGVKVMRWLLVRERRKPIIAWCIAGALTALPGWPFATVLRCVVLQDSYCAMIDQALKEPAYSQEQQQLAQRAFAIAPGRREAQIILEQADERERKKGHEALARFATAVVQDPMMWAAAKAWMPGDDSASDGDVVNNPRIWLASLAPEAESYERKELKSRGVELLAPDPSPAATIMREILILESAANEETVQARADARIETALKDPGLGRHETFIYQMAYDRLWQRKFWHNNDDLSLAFRYMKKELGFAATPNDGLPVRVRPPAKLMLYLLFMNVSPVGANLLNDMHKESVAYFFSDKIFREKFQTFADANAEFTKPESWRVASFDLDSEKNKNALRESTHAHWKS